MMENKVKSLLKSESTHVDFKVSLEKSKPKSWIKTVVAFANGIGGSLLFGVDDNRQIAGLQNIHDDSEKISNLIKTKIDPLIHFELTPVTVDEKNILFLYVPPGKMTPYYYVNEGTRTAFVRMGNESVTAPSYIIHELTLKGQRMSFDGLSTAVLFDDASFTLFKSTFFTITGTRIEGRKDYLSFGMIDQDDRLTYAGLLLSDNCALLQSRIFCTRWSGTGKGIRNIDAIDDKEFSGNVISLLKEAASFIRSHSMKAWRIEGMYRTEYADYPENAVREALVNALVHRDYNIIGSEIHIDMYEDRLEIVSPGGMFDGKNIQEADLDRIASIRRNPILADIMSRLEYMERRGSGLKRIKDSFVDQNLVEFYSNETNFYVIMKKQHQDLQSDHDHERIKSGWDQNMSGFTTSERLIADYILSNSKITTKDAATLTKLSPAQVRRLFVSLQEKHMINAVGEGRGRHYTLRQ